MIKWVQITISLPRARRPSPLQYLRGFRRQPRTLVNKKKPIMRPKSGYCRGLHQRFPIANICFWRPWWRKWLDRQWCRYICPCRIKRLIPLCIPHFVSDNESKGRDPILFWDRLDQWRPFPLRRYDNIHHEHLVSFLHSKVTFLGFRPVWGRVIWSFILLVGFYLVFIPSI